MKKILFKMVRPIYKKVEKFVIEEEKKEKEIKLKELEKMLDAQMKTLVDDFVQESFLNESNTDGEVGILPEDEEDSDILSIEDNDLEIQDYDEIIFVECEKCGNMFSLSKDEDKGFIECSDCGNEIFIENESLESNIYDENFEESDSDETARWVFTSSPRGFGRSFSPFTINSNNDIA